jgi:hypothetical protein
VTIYPPAWQRRIASKINPAQTASEEEQINQAYSAEEQRDLLGLGRRLPRE